MKLPDEFGFKTILSFCLGSTLAAVSFCAGIEAGRRKQKIEDKEMKNER